MYIAVAVIALSLISLLVTLRLAALQRLAVGMVISLLLIVTVPFALMHDFVRDLWTGE
jgi:hypothetical protein